MLFDTTTTTPTSTELTAEMSTRIHDQAAEESLIRIRPFVETEGLAAGPAFLRGLHRSPAGTVSHHGAPVYAFELWFVDGTLQFHLRAPDPQDTVGLVNAHYPNSDTEIQPGEPFPPLSAGAYAASCHLTLCQDPTFPMKHLRSDPALDSDPYRTLLSQLRGGDAESVLFQIVFMPVRPSWTKRGLVGRIRGGDVERVAAARRQGRVRGYVEPETVQSSRDRRAADDIAAQVGRPAFATTIRAVAIAPDAATAEHRLSRVADAMGRFAHDTTGQRFDPTYAAASHAPAVLEAAAQRVHTPASRLRRVLWGRRDILTVDELAGLVHLPNEAVDIPAIDWARRAAGGGVPADSRQYSTDGPTTEQTTTGQRTAPPPADAASAQDMSWPEPRGGREGDDGGTDGV